MKSNITILTTFLFTTVLLSFTKTSNIDNCFISFTKSGSLTATSPDRLPATAEKVRLVKTSNGDIEITCIDGYRVLYNNDKKAPFVNLKVELSNKKSYVSDQKGLIGNLKYLNSRSNGMETKGLIELKFNGYKIFGLSRASIETGNILGTFIMFPGNDVIVYFYFNNLKPGFRHFESVDDYKKLRDKFMDEYTKHLTKCVGK